MTPPPPPLKIPQAQERNDALKSIQIMAADYTKSAAAKGGKKGRK